MLRHPSIRSSRRSPKTLHAAFLALATGGCGRQFDLGEITRLLEEDGTPSAAATPLEGTVLLSSVDDLDAIVSNAAVPPAQTTDILPVALGDVDGDGLGDWIQGDTLLYGAPRPEGAELQVAGTARFVFDVGGNGTFRAAGDVNGDGLMDILFGAEQTVWVSTNDIQPARRIALREPVARLVLGSRERFDGDVELASVGYAFGDRDALVERFTDELAADPSDSFARQETQLVPLGDLNGDGLADFVSTSAIVFTRDHFDADGTLASTEMRSERVSYVHHGHGDPLQIAEPGARLDSDVYWAAAGDVDGDGLGDVIWTSPEASYLLSGSAAEAGGELALGQAVEVHGMPPRFYMEQRDPLTGALGDLDGDGFDDFALNAGLVVNSPTDVNTPWFLFYGGAGLLERPLDGARAAAVFETELYSTITPLGDWDGDGHRDLLLSRDLWLAGTEPFSSLPEAREAVLLRGSPERFSGQYFVSLYRSELAAGDTTRGLVPVAAGDLDGDGFADMFVKGLYATSLNLGIIYGSAPPAPTIH